VARAPSLNADASATGCETSGPREAPCHPEARLLYICGPGHSGSTLLEMFLAGHPEIAALGELHNLNHQIAVGRPCSCGAPLKSCGRWQAGACAIRARTGDEIFERPFAFRLSRERPRDLRERAVRNWNRAVHYASFRWGALGRLGLRRVVVGGPALAANTALVDSAVRALSGARILVDSSKDCVRMRERYSAEPAGRVKVLNLCRDGRGVVWSAHKYYGRGTDSRWLRYYGRSMWNGSRQWAKTQRRIRAMLRGVRAEDRMDLRYEDLCAEPEGVLRRVCIWLGLPFSNAMLRLDPPEHHAVAGNRIRFQRAMPVRLDEEWRTRLTPGQLRLFDLIAGAENRRLGYPRH